MLHEYLVALSFFFLVGSGSVAASPCVLPIADGAEFEPSQASLIGELASVAPGAVSVRRAGGGIPVHVIVSPSTELFTVYGGGFDEPDLRQGQHVLVWFENCKAPKRGPPIAAVLEICSLGPEPCPK